MSNVLKSVIAPGNDPEGGASTSYPRRRRDDRLQEIKFALVVSELSLVEPRRGFDPYNARLGRSPRELWDRRRRTR
jgi:hypothetical protein